MKRRGINLKFGLGFLGSWVSSDVFPARKAKRDLSFARASPRRVLTLGFAACILRTIITGLSK